MRRRSSVFGPRGRGLVSDLRDLVGVELGPTSWLEVTQERIDAFAAATSYPQWIHVDPERAAAGPFGTTIAHGFLTLSFCVPMLDEALPAERRDGVNYGTTAFAFPLPFRPEVAFAVAFASPRSTRSPGVRAAIEAAVECDAVEKPVCVAELVVLTVP